MIFDSLTHPTLSGNFLGKKGTYCSEVSAKLSAVGFKGGLAVGMPGTGAYNHEGFANEVSQFSNLVPIAAMTGEPTPAEEIEIIRALPYRGVKIHPRFLRNKFDRDWLVQALESCSKAGLPVMLCCYPMCSVQKHERYFGLLELIETLQALQQTPKILLVHGGGVELMRYAELVRNHDDLTLDLSLTFLKYPGSSVDLDIDFIFRHFDQRATLGTDYPDFEFTQTLEKFRRVAQGVSEEKLRRIAYENIQAFIGI